MPSQHSEIVFGSCVTVNQFKTLLDDIRYKILRHSIALKTAEVSGSVSFTYITCRQRDYILFNVLIFFV